MGVFKHPDGSEHIVARDHGFSPDVMKAYAKARNKTLPTANIAQARTHNFDKDPNGSVRTSEVKAFADFHK